MSDFEVKQCELLATYTPFQFTVVRYWFLHCNRSFDKTLAKLENISAGNK